METKNRWITLTDQMKSYFSGRKTEVLSEQDQLSAVKKDPWMIGNIQNPSEKVQFAAVEKNCWVIEDIESPTKKVQMCAVEKDYECITLIKKPCEEAQIYAAEQDPHTVTMYASSEAARMVAIEHDPTVIVHIDNPSSDLCKAAVEKAFPGVAIDYPFTPVETQSLIEKIKDIEIAEERIKIFEEFKNDIATEKSVRIEAIQILEGNAPERIFEEKFVLVRNQFPFEEKQLNESINDIESGIKYSEPRMLSDNHFKKIEIQGSAQYFANQIKKDFTPEELLTSSKELESPLNLPLGKTPTTEEALALFLNEYGDRVHSALYENEKAGRYEVSRPTIEYEYKSEELLHAGTHPYSPNYKEVFEKAGLANEFKTFEKACCERAQWNHSYNYAVATRDIAELNDLERKLPILNEKVESSREQVYNKLLNAKLEKEVKQLGEALKYGGNGLLDVRGQLSNNASQFLEKYGMKEDAEKYTRIISIDPNIYDIPQAAEKFIDEFAMKVKTAAYYELNNINRADIIQKIKEDEYVGADIKTIEKNTKLDGSLTNEYMSLVDSYKNLGYPSVADTISSHFPYYNNIIASGSSLTYKIENVEIVTSGAKVLYGDITISKNVGKVTANIENYRIKDKVTGLTETLQTGNIDISKQPADQIKKLLTGSKVQTTSAATGITQMIGLNKTPMGWGLSIGKQIFNTADSSAEI